MKPSVRRYRCIRTRSGVRYLKRLKRRPSWKTARNATLSYLTFGTHKFVFFLPWLENGKRLLSARRSVSLVNLAQILLGQLDVGSTSILEYVANCGGFWN